MTAQLTFRHLYLLLPQIIAALALVPGSLPADLWQPQFEKPVLLSRCGTSNDACEPSLAANGRGGLLCAWMELGSKRTIGYSLSENFATSWFQPREIPDRKLRTPGDPVAVMWGQSSLALVWCEYARSEVMLSRSSNGGKDWSLILNTHIDQDKNFTVQDRAWCVADGQRILIAYGNYRPGSMRWSPNGRILLSRSEDGGVSWSTSVLQDCEEQRENSSPVLAYDKTRNRLFACWLADAGEEKEFSEIRLAVSEDFGKSFSKPLVLRQFVTFRHKDRQQCWPTICVNTAGTLFVAWNELPWPRSPEGDRNVAVYCAVSIDGGRTFAQPVSVASFGATGRITKTSYIARLMPQLAADSTGRVHLFWLDSAIGNSETSNSAGFHIAHSYSLDNGKLFSLPVAVTLRKFPDKGFLGDFIGAAADSEYVYAAWTDTTTDPTSIAVSRAKLPR